MTTFQCASGVTDYLDVKDGGDGEVVLVFRTESPAGRGSVILTAPEARRLRKAIKRISKGASS